MASRLEPLRPNSAEERKHRSAPSSRVAFCQPDLSQFDPQDEAAYNILGDPLGQNVSIADCNESLLAARRALQDVTLLAGRMDTLAKTGKDVIELCAALSSIARNDACQLLGKNALGVIAGYAVIAIDRARLEQMRSALSEITSLARCAYRAVVSGSAWPSNLPIVASGTPFAMATEAKL